LFIDYHFKEGNTSILKLFILYYVGVRKLDNSYTTPVLEIHTWRKEMKQSNLNRTTTSQRVALGGLQTQRDNADRHTGPLHGTEHRQIELGEEIQCIPIESIISIKYSGEVRKELTEKVHTRIPTPPPSVRLSCCQKVNQWCSKTFCCCCNKSKNQVHIDSGRTVVEIVGEKGERVILISIEYIRYHNINTPSYFNALATADATSYYKDHLHTDKLNFYLLNNQDFDQTDFNLKRAQGSTLCRLVTLLKAMDGEYPDESTLENIIDKHEIQTIGDPPKETMDKIVGHGTTTTTVETRVPLQALQN
jgi:hypothetical protein